MGIENQEINFIHCITQIREAKSELQKLEKQAARTYGEIYWLNHHFQESGMSLEMTAHVKTINYFKSILTSNLNLN
jgi:hypothetical protein